MILAEVLSSTADLGEGKFDKLHLLPCLYLHWDSNTRRPGIDLGLVISEDADKRLKDTKEQ